MALLSPVAVPSGVPFGLTGNTAAVLALLEVQFGLFQLDLGLPIAGRETLFQSLFDVASWRMSPHLCVCVCVWGAEMVDG